MKRTNDEKIIGMPTEVAINGKQCKVKRLKVREVNELIAAKMDRTKKAQASQMKLAKIQLAVQNGNLESLGIAEEDVDKAIEDIQAMLGEMAIEAGGAHNMWLIESCVEADKADLEDIEFDEYDAAVDAIFEVNPSLGKSKEMLLMNPFQMNQNG
ncbi:hypothetical protein [Deinococcus aquaticus]|uniref:Transcriptional regulator n=1 Tax=Deinococcus aquaticus TaxID=328692 RepID=A0ABY7UZ16_9DEIO|nr:hypothetical protein [Deinococcus aquaticus]WDA58167.1 hypothetical protein M8445_12530 [Deinococcus aquaticus]